MTPIQLVFIASTTDVMCKLNRSLKLDLILDIFTVIYGTPLESADERFYFSP